MKKRMNNFFATALFTLLLLMLVGCSEKKETEAQDENIKTIEAVLQNSLIGPSDELKQILDKGSEEKYEALNQYNENLFKIILQMKRPTRNSLIATVQH
ncbi:putative tellurite resistance protein B-like protein [Neobacillus niacini]|uniref:hypothetical protein n=1 Tax=Neobacillus driksii TaxID=3035913 RepID=UPI002787C0E0|nr:hypothetical protein [Neobacillus niacini]MDQ0970776.1 putative tellurite resistance protein B-like protein [Neobacillus niacini]